MSPAHIRLVARRSNRGSNGSPLVDRGLVEAPHIQMQGITKRFAGVPANDDVGLDLPSGEVHGLLGENGAGKSTLMNVLFGLLAPDSGRILVDGEATRMANPASALRAGVGMVHQHFMLVPNLTVAQNIAIGSRTHRRERFRPRQIESAVAVVAEKYGLEIDPSALIADLGVEDRQRVEIMKLLYRGAKTLILDEPTASLGSAQIRSLLDIVKGLRLSGHSIVIVTHKLDEIMDVADRATVMCAGRVTACFNRSEFDHGKLTKAMFADLPARRPKAAPPSHGSPIRLEVDSLSLRSADGHQRLNQISMSVRAGEIVAVAGVAGNGQSELIQVLAGTLTPSSGRVVLDGRDVTGSSTLERRKLGMGIIPEDRHALGLVLDMTVSENLALSRVATGRLSRRGVLQRAALTRDAMDLLDEFDVRPRDPNRPAIQLSGGNQQKVVVARELSSHPGLLIVSSPTRGVDLRAATAIHAQIEAAAENGCAVFLSSPDLDELMALSHRIVVVFEGQIVYEAPTDDASLGEISQAMVRGSDRLDHGTEWIA